MATDDARARFATELRATIDDFLSFQHNDDGLERAAELLADARRHLVGPPAPRYYEGQIRSQEDRADGFANYLNETPFGGGNNPISPPGTLALNADGSVTGKVAAGRPYEGPARCLHGGYVAGLFDHFLGMTQHAYNQSHGTNFMAATRELTIRYLAPTPLDTELTFHAEMEDVDDRTLRGNATCHAGDVLTATASGTFVKLGAGRILSTDPDGFASRPAQQ